MRVWIDVTNSPHVLFFAPLIRELEAAGHEVQVTARDYAQTQELLERHGIRYASFGRHRGGRRAAKALGLIARSLRLAAFGLGRRFDVAASHNSPYLSVAAWLLRVPHLVAHDYEHAADQWRVAARFADRLLVPEAIPTEAIVAHGAAPEKVGHFPGLKEHVYLSPEAGEEDLRAELCAADDDVLVVVRPPATMSAYHAFENDLFAEIVEDLGRREGVRMLLMPRTPAQREALRDGLPASAVLPERVYDGPSLIRSADLVLSAGGTMNREAAVLGTPAYTVFAGEPGAVDAFLIEKGLLVRVERPEDLDVRRKRPGQGYWVENRSVILEELERLAGGRR